MLSEVNIHIALCMLETLIISVFQLLVTENRSIDITEYVLSVGVGEQERSVSFNVNNIGIAVILL